LDLDNRYLQKQVGQSYKGIDIISNDIHWMKGKESENFYGALI